MQLAAVSIGRYTLRLGAAPAWGGILSPVPNRCHACMVEVPNPLI
jgi:hypothetical protein